MADPSATDPPANTETTERDGQTFTREEVEGIVGDRIRKIRTERDDLRTQLAEATERAAQVEQLERRVESLTQERDEAQQHARSTQERALNAQLRAEVTTAAVKARAVDPDDVFRLLPDGAVTVNAESGAVEGVDAAVQQLADSKPHLFAPSRPGPSDGGARSDGGRTEPQRPVDMNELLRGSRSRSA